MLHFILAPSLFLQGCARCTKAIYQYLSSILYFMSVKCRVKLTPLDQSNSCFSTKGSCLITNLLLRVGAKKTVQSGVRCDLFWELENFSSRILLPLHPLLLSWQEWCQAEPIRTSSEMQCESIGISQLFAAEESGTWLLQKMENAEPLKEKEGEPEPLRDTLQRNGWAERKWSSWEARPCVPEDGQISIWDLCGCPSPNISCQLC